jgi:hypothetical protein
MHYVIILVVDFNVFNMKTAPTKLITVYTTLQQRVGLALIWLVGLNRKKLELYVCVFLFFFLSFYFFTVCQTWLTEHSFCVMQKSGIIHLLC